MAEPRERRAPSAPYPDHSAVQAPDLRRELSAALAARAEEIVADAAVIFSRGRPASFDVDYCRRLGLLLLRGLARAVDDGGVGARDALIGELHRTAAARSLDVDALFAFAYLVERAALDDLAVGPAHGAATESWPHVVQIVRRGSYELLAACAARAGLASGGAIADPLTTLYSRPMFDAVFAKELERGGRFGAELSLVLFDVDHLGAINAQQGAGVGDRILERIGILLRSYFRQHDWVARYGDDAFAILLIGTGADRSAALADRARTAVAARLGFLDHRTQAPVEVTLSGAVISVTVGVGDVVDPVRVSTAAETAVERAKRAGRNRVERVDGYSAAVSS